MISELLDARRRRSELTRRIETLRATVDRELGSLLQELHAIERLEREGERQMRALEPELFVESAG